MKRFTKLKTNGPTYRTIMIVEDDESICFGLTCMLEMEGYRVISANSATQAITTLELTSVPDLILTDYIMPNGNGDLVAEYAHKNGDIPLIMITGLVEEAKSALKHRGIENPLVLLKPVPMAPFLQWIKSKINPMADDRFEIAS